MPINPEKITEQQKLAVLKGIFGEDIDAFGQFFYKSHFTKATPDFHKEIYKLYESDYSRIVLCAPRGHAKSTITDLVFLSWCIVNKKAKFVLLVSDTYSQACLFLETIKAEFEANDRLKGFYGDMSSKKWAEGEIIVNGILIKAVGAGSKVRGLKYRESRPDLVIVDDLENDEMVESPERRAKLERWFNGALVPSLAEAGRIVMIGTILHYDSLLCKMLQPDNYTEYEKKIYRAEMNGDALWKEHLNLEQLEVLKQDYITKGLGFQFFREYMNDPVSDDNQKFQPEAMCYYEDHEMAGRMLSTYITIDRAYSIEKTADFTGIVVVSVDRDNVWFVRMAERFKGTEKDLIDRLFDLNAHYKPTKFGIEQKAYEHTLKGHMDDEMRRRNEFFNIEKLKDLGRSKSLRIEGLVPRYTTGSMKFKKDQHHIREELERFPRGAHDDLLDALAYQLVIADAPDNRQNKYKDIQEMEAYDYEEWS